MDLLEQLACYLILTLRMVLFPETCIQGLYLISLKEIQISYEPNSIQVQ